MLRLFEGRQDQAQEVLAPWVEPEPAQAQVEAPRPRAQTPVRESRGAKQIIAFCGAGGSVGRTSVAINVAYELADAGHRVALFDFDFDSPNLMTALNQDAVTPGLSGVSRLLSQGRFQPAELARFLMVLNFDGVRLSVLPGLSSPLTQHLDFALTKELMKAAIEAVDSDFVVIDLPDARHRLDTVKKCLDLADLGFVLCGSDPVGVQRFLWLKNQLSDLEPEQVPQLICNRVRDSVLGANPKSQLAETFERLAQTDVVAFIPEDAPAFDISMREGLPLQLAKKSSAARHAISMFVRQGILGQRSRLDWRLARHG